MNKIFISHSSADNSYALRVSDFLRHIGHQSIFLDFDPEDGIPAGRSWEKELYLNLRKCQVVIVLYSKDFSTSHWCFAEITHAKALGKFIIPLKINECNIDNILVDVQVIDATGNEDEAFKRLANGLLQAGIIKEGWDNTRPPYPGLLSFEEEDAPIFFGREEETENFLKLIRQFRDFGGPKLLLVLGASGSGKSSLIKAGIIPKLKKDNSWIIIRPFRPLKNPFEEFSKSIADAYKQLNYQVSWQDVFKSWQINSRKSSEISKSLSLNFFQIIQLSRFPRVTVVIFIDQFEELLFNVKISNVNDETTISLFLSCLKDFLNTADTNFLVIASLRSDFLGNFEINESLKAISFNNYIVNSVKPENLKASIEEPAKIAGIELEDGLAEIIVQDTETPDALPLLAFTLRELWEQYGRGGYLQIDDYRNRLGGLEGSIANVAEAVLMSYVAQTGNGEVVRILNIVSKAQLNSTDEKLLKAAFISMVRIDDQGRFTRRFSKWEQLSPLIYDLLERFITARLLVIDRNGKDIKIEVAHEALFRTWKRLVAWLDEDKSFFLWKKKLNLALEEWERNARNESALISGPALAEANEWIHQYKEGKYHLTPEEIDIVEASNKKEQFEKFGEEKRRLKELRTLRFLFLSAIIVVAITSGFGYWIYNNNVEARNELETGYWDRSRRAYQENDLLAALCYTAEGISISEDRYLNNNMLLDIQPFLPKTILETIVSHNSSIYTAIFSPDGKRILTASQDFTARIWDVKTGMPLTSPMKHPGVVHYALFSLDGKQVFTLCSNDNIIRVWDSKTGAFLNAPLKDVSIISLPVISPNGEQILTTGFENSVRTWDIKTGVPISAPMKHNGDINSAVFSEDGKQVITGSHDSTARVWNAKTGAPIGVPLKHNGIVVIAILSHDGKQILTACSDGIARLWDAKSGSLLQRTMKHNAVITSAVFNDNGNQVLTASRDSTARLWDIKTGASLGAPMKHDGEVNSAIFSPDGKLVLTSSNNSSYLWDAKTGLAVTVPMKHEGFVMSTVFSPDGKRILSASSDSTARIWHLSPAALTGAPITRDRENYSVIFKPEETNARDVSYGWSIDPVTNDTLSFSRDDDGIGYCAIFSPDGKVVFTLNHDSTVRIWNAKTGLIYCASMKHDDLVTSLVLSPDGKRILTTSLDNTARIWDAKTGALSALIKHDNEVKSAIFSPNGKMVFTASRDKMARLWNAKNGAALTSSFEVGDVISASFSPNAEQIVTAMEGGMACIWNAKTGALVASTLNEIYFVNAAAFSPDGKEILTCSFNNTARLWNSKDGKPMGPPMRHEDGVLRAIFSQDGRNVLTASKDYTARVWDAKTGLPSSSVMKHAGVVNSVVFSSNGKQVLTASRDNTARLWDAKTGSPIGLPMKHEASVFNAVFSPDEKQVLTISEDRNAKIWDIEGDLDISADLFKLQARAITGVELNTITGETHCVLIEEFKQAEVEYKRKGEDHYRVCKYRSYNLWSKFYAEEAMKIDEKK